MTERDASMPRRVTLRDVAREVGVTESTASMVLNGARTGTRVSPATRERLQAAAGRMGYRPNELARSLSHSRTRMLGFFSHFETISSRNLFLSELVGGVQDAASEAGYDLVLYTAPYGRPADDVIAHLADRRVDGLLFLAPSSPELLPSIARAGLPVVGLVDLVPGVPCITVDDDRGGRLVARHLHAQGHRSAIYRGWHQEPASGAVRRRGFQAEAAVLGITVHEGRALDSTFQGALLPHEIALVENGVRAFVCWGDPTASATCDALAARGLRIPEDVAVTGFNGLPTETSPRWDLTTIRADWRGVGALGVEKLLTLLSDTPTAAREGVTVPVEFIPGLTA